MYLKYQKYKHKMINEDKCKDHYSYKDNKYVSYCLDCNIHLCNEYLKTGNHINNIK